jgi:hypothetical protein
MAAAQYIAFQMLGNLKCTAEVDNTNMVLGAEGILVGSIETVIGSLNAQPPDVNMAGMSSRAGPADTDYNRGFDEELQAFGQSLSDADFENFWRTFVMDHDWWASYFADGRVQIYGTQYPNCPLTDQMNGLLHILPASHFSTNLPAPIKKDLEIYLSGMEALLANKPLRQPSMLGLLSQTP